MINHRIANHRWCLLFLSITTLLFPLVSFSQTYTSFVGNGSNGQVLATDGFAYDGGTMYPPGQTIPMSQMMYATGSCGATTSPNGNPCTQVIGLGRQDGLAYLVGFWSTGGVYQAEGILPGQSTRFSQLAAQAGWGNDGGFWNGGTWNTVYTNNFLQVIGLGANDGLAYLAAYQDTGGTWHSGGILPGQTIPFAQLYVVPGNAGKLQVIGRAVSDNRLYLSAFQDNNGNWQASGLLPGQVPSSSSVTVVGGNPGAVQVLSLGTDGYIYLTDWQDSSGTWHAAGILPGQSTPLENIVATEIRIGNITAGTDWTNQLIVGGIGASDHIFHLTNWQDGNGNWNAYNASSLSVQIPQVPMAQAFVNPGDNCDNNADDCFFDVVFYGIGQNNNHIYALAQDADGTWYGGYDQTAALTSPAAPVLSSSVTFVNTGVPFTLSWTVPSGTVDHYEIGVDGTTAITSVAASTNSATETGTAATGNTVSYTYQVRACSTTSTSSCGAWSNIVTVAVHGANPHCGHTCP